MTPPNDLDAENRLVAILLSDLDGSSTATAAAEITPEDFDHPMNRIIYGALTERPMDLGHVCERAGITPAQIIAMRDIEPTSMRLPAIIERVKRASHRRRVFRTAAELQEAALAEYFNPDAIPAIVERAVSLRVRKHQEVFSHTELLAFDPAKDEASLMGNRYLCRTGSLLVVSQSGIGKSVFALQLAVAVASDQPHFFGISIRRGLKVLFIQAENDLGDMAEAYQGVMKAQETLPDTTKRLKVVRDSVSTGEQFVAMLRRELATFPADIIIVDPLMSFTGCDVSDQEAMTRFLRNQLNPVLMETGAAVVVIHHTGKPMGAQDGAAKTRTDVDKSYLGIGTSDLTNWARAVIVLQKETKEEQVYRVTLAKRGWKAGVIDDNGARVGFFFLQHGKSGGIAWEASDYKPEDKPKGGRPSGFDAGRILAQLSRDEWVTTKNWQIASGYTAATTFDEHIKKPEVAGYVESRRVANGYEWRRK